MKRAGFLAQTAIVIGLCTGCLDDLATIIEFVDLTDTPAGESADANSSIERADRLLDDAVKTADFDLLSQARAERPDDPEYAAYNFAFNIVAGSPGSINDEIAGLKALILAEDPTLTEPGLTERTSNHLLAAIGKTNEGFDWDNYQYDPADDDRDPFRLRRLGCHIAQLHSEYFGSGPVVMRYHSEC